MAQATLVNTYDKCSKKKAIETSNPFACINLDKYSKKKAIETSIPSMKPQFPCLY